MPCRTVNSRFSPEEYKTLYEASRARARKNKGNGRQWACEQLHDYILFMATTGLRPDEANTLEFRDVEIVEDDGTGETILVISVRGKARRRLLQEHGERRAPVRAPAEPSAAGRRRASMKAM